MSDTENIGSPTVEKFRQVVFWPVQLIVEGEEYQKKPFWEILQSMSKDTPWRAVSDEFSASERKFSERRYREFVSFLPFAQRFLYGEGTYGGNEEGFGESPVHVFSREDVQKARIKFAGDEEALLFDVDNVDLYFFYDIDVAFLVLGLNGKNLNLQKALDVMFRFGRAYPSHWDADGHGGHCAEKIEWLDAEGNLLAASDYEIKERYLDFVRDQRVPLVASHWAYLMAPLVQHYSAEKGPIRYREIEYQRMPMMTYLAFDDVARLSRGDMIRLGLVTRPGDSDLLPYSTHYLEDFESRYCYDRYWDDGRLQHWGKTRFICNGQSFCVIGGAQDAFFVNHENGIVAQFRHQFFLLFLIAHFQKAALLMLSDRLVHAISRLDIDQPESVKKFRVNVNYTQEIFLRFTHRYWFHAVSDQPQSRDLFTMMLKQLETEDHFVRTRSRILDMTQYLDSDQNKSHSEMVVRLTVVTAFGLIGSVVTGFLGMNLFAAADSPTWLKVVYFLLTLFPTTLLVFYTVAKSRQLASFLDALSDDTLSYQQKVARLMAVWRKEVNR